MPHCVAFECNVQAKEKQKDPKIRFHTFPKDKELRQAWIHAIGRTSLPKNPRLCSKHFEEHCFKQSYLMEVRLLGSSRMLNPLKTDALPTIFSHRKSAPIRLSSVKRAEKRKHMEVCVCLFICIIHMNGCELASSRFFIIFRLFLTYWVEIHRAQLLKTKFMKLYRRRKKTIHRRYRMRLHSRPSMMLQFKQSGRQ